MQRPLGWELLERSLAKICQVSGQLGQFFLEPVRCSVIHFAHLAAAARCLSLGTGNNAGQDDPAPPRGP